MTKCVIALDVTREKELDLYGKVLVPAFEPKGMTYIQFLLCHTLIKKDQGWNVAADGTVETKIGKSNVEKSETFTIVFASSIFSAHIFLT